MTEIKIVFTGTPGAGKTTAIAALSDVPPMLTDVRSTDPRLHKDRTTVGMDLGQVNLDNGQSVWLFGTPGQLRFEFMWRIVASNALGLVILVDNTREDPLGDLAMYLDAYRDLLPTVNCVIGVGRMVERPVPTLDDYADALARLGSLFPVLAVDVRRRDDVLMLVDTVLAQAELRSQE